MCFILLSYKYKSGNIMFALKLTFYRYLIIDRKTRLKLEQRFDRLNSESKADI